MAVKVAPVIIAASFATLVILAREIDISVGSLMGLCGAVLGVAASTDRLGLSPVVAGALCIGVGLAGGLINGVLVAYARIPSIIVTLGTLTLFRGVTELVLGGKWIENVPPGLRFLGSGSWGGVPLVAGMAVICVLFAAWILRRTRFGLRTYALGSNPQAAKLVGIQETKIRLAIFALAGLAASIAALFSATQLQVIESGFGSGFELTVIASVVVGGTSIRGGRGTVIGTVIGAVLLGIISTALIFLKLGESATYWERAIQGTVILLAILADFLAGKRK
jgi:ribose/xylose/arabinose/galactoside ABC-type transport system permease subunit